MKSSIAFLFVLCTLIGAFCSSSFGQDLPPAAPAASAPAAPAAPAPAAPVAPDAPVQQNVPQPVEAPTEKHGFLADARATISRKLNLLGKIATLEGELKALRESAAADATNLAALQAKYNELESKHAELLQAYDLLKTQVAHENAKASAEIASLGVPEQSLPASASHEQTAAPANEVELNAALEACGGDQVARFRLLRAYRAAQKEAAKLAAA